MRSISPWGWFVTLIKLPSLWVKLIRVKERTSLQTHENRSEWHIGIRRVSPGEMHRLYRGWYIEIAHGTPTEGDIVRISDDYGRSK